MVSVCTVIKRKKRTFPIETNSTFDMDWVNVGIIIVQK